MGQAPPGQVLCIMTLCSHLSQPWALLCGSTPSNISIIIVGNSSSCEKRPLVQSLDIQCPCIPDGWDPPSSYQQLKTELGCERYRVEGGGWLFLSLLLGSSNPGPVHLLGCGQGQRRRDHNSSLGQPGTLLPPTRVIQKAWSLNSLPGSEHYVKWVTATS